MMNKKDSSINKTNGIIYLRRPSQADKDEMMRLFEESRDILEPWIYPPDNPDANLNPDEGRFFLCLCKNDRIAGRINLSCIIRGYLQQAFVGYYVFKPFAGQNIMSQGMQLVLDYAFNDLKLHRIEANIQPENIPSIRFAGKCGFRKEGFSPNYLKVGGKWKDHERWAITLEDWISSGGSN